MAALRRVVLVLLVYAAVAALLLPLLGVLRTGLALPRLFETLARGGLAVGAVVAAVLAAVYPRLAQGERGDPPEE